MSRAGASYRHGDLRAACLRAARDALVPAVAAQGYRELAGHLAAAHPAPVTAADPDALSATVWALVHGLAFLHLDGKLDASTPEAVAARVRTAVHAPAAMSHQATP